MPTIRQVAKACGVSPMTVSFVINNKPGQVSAVTRERVLKAVRELGYRPSAARRTPLERTIYTLGIVAGVPGDSLSQSGYSSVVLHSILAAADHRSQNLTLFTNSLLHTDIHQSLRIYCDGRCDGLLVIAPGINSPLLAALLDRGIPFVSIGDSGDDPRISHVDLENVNAGRMAAEHLQRLGHRAIGFVGSAPFIRSANQRRQGFEGAMRLAGLAVNPNWIVEGVHREPELREAVRLMMSRPAKERPTAVFAWNDGSANTTLQALRELELRVPHDVSVIGIDDDAFAALTEPPLTTLRQPYTTIGQRAVDILLQLIRDRETPPTQEQLPASIVIRSSTAPPATE